MQKFITNKDNGITYELIGDYYYPCLIAPRSAEVGFYGHMRRKYLKEHRKVLYCQLLTSGRLADHLEMIDNEAKEMETRLVAQMASAQGVTEKMKAENMLEWVGLMNNIRACAKEVIMNDLIYV